MILVTGGTGLVGSHLLFDLVKQDKKVRAIKRSNSDFEKVKKVFSYYSSHPEELFNKIEWSDTDILDYDSLRPAMDGIKKVYHAAAIISYSPSDRERMIKNNVEGTANIVNISLEYNIEKLCYVSSIAALGSTDNGEPITEETKWEASESNSGYSISKHRSELEVWRGIAEGLNAVIVNPSVILGPGFWDKGSSNLFKTVYNGFKFYSLGITGFVDVRDVASAMIKLMDSDIVNKRFILSSENITYKKLFEQIAKSLNKKPPKIYANPILTGAAWRAEKIKSFITRKNPLVTRETSRTAHKILNYSNQKITNAIDFKFKPIEESIKETGILFLKDH